MNIGLLITRFPPDWIGGAELQMKQLATVLAQRGHDVTVFTRRYQGRPYLEYQDGYRIRRRNELPIPAFRMLWDTFPALLDIARQRPRPEVLLCYQTINSGFVGVIAQALLGIPAVVSIRGNREYRADSSWPERRFAPGIYRRARRIIVQSARISADFHEQLAAAGYAALSEQVEEKVVVIPNGIELPTGARANGSKVVFVGRLIQNKGVADFLEALKQLPGAEALIVGDGPDRPRLESLAAKLSVTFVRQVMPSQVIEYLRQARLLVLPSYLGDGIPNVILEAMACGVPVVATHTAGIPDLVQHGESGFLFAPGDVAQMAAHIQQLLSDDVLHQRMAQRGLEIAAEYSWEWIVPRIEHVLRQATGAI
jgi:glycosyltransferase involved in cell wall biosynthesis